MDEMMQKKLLCAVESDESIENCLLKENAWEILYHLSPIRENILEWYPFEPDATLLEIGAGCGALTGLFCRKVGRVVAVESSESEAAVNRERNKKYSNLTVMNENFCSMPIEERFDYVTLIGIFGCAGRYDDSDDPYMEMLKKAKTCLKPGGKLFLAVENRYGVKYFAGAKEDYTGRCFDGLENYVAADDVRTFSHKTLDKMLLEAGFTQNEFYYPMPDDKLPSEIYSDECLPSFGSLRYPCVAYDRDRYELLDERLVFDSICQDEMFGDFANSFLIVSENGHQEKQAKEKVVYAKYNRQRAPEYQISTKIIHLQNGKRCVVKEALRPEAVAHIGQLSTNRRKLVDIWEQQKAKTVIPYPIEILLNENGCAKFPYIQGQSLAKEVTMQLGRREAFLKAMHQAVDSIYSGYLKSPEGLIDFQITKEFEAVFGAFTDAEEIKALSEMKSLKVSNIDSILSNFVRLSDGRLVCLDYEWVFDFPIPVDYLIYRTVYYYFSENIHYIKINELEFLAEFGISAPKMLIFRKMDDHFQQYAHGSGRRYMYTSNYAKKTLCLGKNLQFGEPWFLSIANDVHNLNVQMGRYRKDLLECHVKVHQKSVFLHKCKNKIKRIVRKVIRK